VSGPESTGDASSGLVEPSWATLSVGMDGNGKSFEGGRGLEEFGSDCNSRIRSRNAASTAPASAVVSVFFVPRLRRAHSTAASSEPRSAISLASLRERSDEALPSSTGAPGLTLPYESFSRT
jgi:hypothetical protein